MPLSCVNTSYTTTTHRINDVLNNIPWNVVRLFSQCHTHFISSC